jgi:hypothetical protein
MRMYPRFFADFQRLGLLDEKIFSEMEEEPEEPENQEPS